MGWRDILRSPDPSRALYLAMRANPTASAAADTFQGGFEGAMEGLGNVGRVATIPARALAGAAAKYGAGVPMDVGHYALTGEGPSVQYGDVLAGSMEDTGELRPGGVASKVIRAVGNMITDPGAAPSMLSGADALGSLAGKLGPQGSTFPDPQTVRPFPRSHEAGRPVAPAEIGSPMETPSTVPPRRGMKPAPSDKLPKPDKTPTGDFPKRPRFSTAGPGWYEPAPGEPGPSMGPDVTQPLRIENPDATQRVPLKRTKEGLRPKAARKRRTATAEEK